MKMALVFGETARSKAFDVVAVGPDHLPAETLEGVVELVDRAAIELSRGDEFVAGLQQRLEHDHLRRMARGDRERRRAAFERRDALLQHRVGRVADAGVDVAERLQAEQRGGMVGVVEDERGGLIDRRRPRAGGRIGLRAGVNGQGGESGSTLGHALSFVVDVAGWIILTARVSRQGEAKGWFVIRNDVLRGSAACELCLLRYAIAGRLRGGSWRRVRSRAATASVRWATASCPRSPWHRRRRVHRHALLQPPRAKAAGSDPAAAFDANAQGPDDRATHRRGIRAASSLTASSQAPA